MNHEALCEEAKRAIDRVFSDTSVPQCETVVSLADIVAHCNMLIDSVCAVKVRGPKAAEAAGEE